MDSYQPIYDAVRSRISNGDVGSAVAEVARQSFDISWTTARIQEAFISAANEMQRPFMLLKPAVFPDGKAWCALYGADLHAGVAGFGDTPAAAAADFDKNWLQAKVSP